MEIVKIVDDLMKGVMGVGKGGWELIVGVGLRCLYGLWGSFPK